MTTPPNSGGQQPSPETGQTSWEAGGSIRDRLRSPVPSEQANSGGDDSRSDLDSGSFTQTDSREQLKQNGRDENQRSTSAGTEAVDVMEPRPTDLSPAAAKAAERKVASLFLLSVVGVVGFVVWFFAGPQEFGTSGSILYTPLLGVFMTLALGGIGAGAVLWAKLLMSDEEAVQKRSPFASPADERSATAQALTKGFKETQLARRPLLGATLALGAGSLALLPLPFVFGFGRFQNKEDKLGRTAWREGMRLVRDNGTYVRLGDLQIGSVESVFPDVEGGNHVADSPTLLIRMRPEELELDGLPADWAYQGHVAYSSVCTHLGCPVKLYEQTTHNLLCPCHQSVFNAAEGARVIFGPAARALPQLPIGVDEEGFFVALSDYPEPVGPSYWERG